VRGGGGPEFLESRTYRYRGHHVGDVDRRYYRSREEEEERARDRDPLRRLANWLITEELAEELTFTHIHEEAGAADCGRDDLSGELSVRTTTVPPQRIGPKLRPRLFRRGCSSVAGTVGFNGSAAILAELI
jgi:hypothetical protein